MAINIKNAEAVAQIRRLARLKHLDLTEAVLTAVNNELERMDERQESRLHRMRAIADRVAALPVLDERTPDEILNYDASGLPS